jgi:hypothetical protein
MERVGWLEEHTQDTISPKAKKPDKVAETEAKG